MLRLLYTLVFLLALPFIFTRLWWKEKQVPGYRIRWLQRLGIFKSIKSAKPLIWVHAVSVGEVIAATPLIQRLLDEGACTLMVTTMTPTGSDRVVAAFGAAVEHVYAPYDLPWTVAAFIRRTRPALIVIIETEIWPNMLNVCAKKQVPMILANARLSARSARRYGYFKKTTQHFFNLFSNVAVQNIADGERFLNLGLNPSKLVVIGNVKFDIQIAQSLESRAAQLRKQYSSDGARPIVIAASTHQGEECAILDAWPKVLATNPTALLVLVPRHPERFDDVHRLCAGRFNTIKRSELVAPKAQTQVVLGDSMGELMLFYGAADIAFVGGSLIERGGHNMIEPATWGLPIVCGPHTFNFADVSLRLSEAGGMATINNGLEFAAVINQWLRQPQQCAEVGQQALSFTQKNRGAIARLLSLIERYQM